MRKILLVMKLIAAILVGCAVPIQSSSPTPQPAAPTFTAASPTRPPSPTPAAPKASPTATLSPAGSDAPLGSSVLLAAWDNRRMQHELRPIDPRQGLPLSAYAPILLGRNYQYAFAPDGKMLAVVVYPSDTTTLNASLHLIDLQAWRNVTTTLKFDNWISAMTFSPDGAHLAVAYSAELMVIDLAAQSVVAKTSAGFLPRVLAYTSDGKSLTAYGTAYESGNGLNPIARAALMDAHDLSIKWSLPLPAIWDGQYGQTDSHEPGGSMWWTPAVVPALDRQMLYIVHADEDKLTTVNFARRAATTVEIGPARSWLEQWLTLGAGVAYAKTLDGTRKHAVLSRDGTRLYIVGETGKSTQDANQQWQFTQTPLNLQVVDVASGVQIAKVETQANEISLSPDGSQLYLRGWSDSGVPWTEVLDAARLEVVARLTGRYLIPARQMDGQPILLASDTHTGSATLAALEAQSLQEIQVWSVPGYADWLSPLWNRMQW